MGYGGDPAELIDPTEPLWELKDLFLLLDNGPPEPKEICEVSDKSWPGVRVFRLGVQFTKSEIIKSETKKNIQRNIITLETILILK